MQSIKIASLVQPAVTKVSLPFAQPQFLHLSNKAPGLPVHGALTPLHIRQGGGCVVQAPASIRATGQRQVATSGREAGQSCVEPPAPAMHTSPGKPDTAEAPKGVRPIQHLTQFVVTVGPILQRFIMQNFKTTQYRQQSVMKAQAPSI